MNAATVSPRNGDGGQDTTVGHQKRHQHDEDWSLPHNACAQSDLEAAIKAIQDTVQQELMTDFVTNSDNVTKTLFQDIQTVLVELLQQAVIPVSDHDFQDYVDLYHIIPIDIDDIEEQDVEEEIKEEEEEEEEEMDPDDLLDHKALQEARQLRRIVRDLSKNVEQKRERVLKDSLATIVSYQGDNNDGIETDLNVETDFNSEQEEKQREALHGSLGALSSLLQDSQWNDLPRQLESLQRTIEAIHKDSDTDRPMSQIEAAIISNPNGTTNNDTTDHWEDAFSEEMINITAADRLARFFAQIQ